MTGREGDRDDGPLHRARDEELDLVTQDMLIGQARKLEHFHWFVRAHLESADGTLSTGGARTENAAARSAEER